MWIRRATLQRLNERLAALEQATRDLWVPERGTAYEVQMPQRDVLTALMRKAKLKAVAAQPETEARIV
jgi:hypothetical protein